MRALQCHTPVITRLKQRLENKLEVMQAVFTTKRQDSKNIHTIRNIEEEQSKQKVFYI